VSGYLDHVEAAAKAAFPELWEEDSAIVQMLPPAHLTMHRQQALDRAQKALAALQQAEAATGSAEHIALHIPDDAAILQQTLAITTYIDKEGQEGYAVQIVGEGSMIRLLGMNLVCQEYLMALARKGPEPDGGNLST
jgi:hypothetical protein